MPDSVHFEIASLMGFLLVLARVGSAVLFVPIPGIKAMLDPARALLILGVTLIASSAWPRAESLPITMGGLLLALAFEGCIGLAVGLLVGFLGEALVLGVQFFATQAGYSYASTFDPTSEADSGVLQVIAQITGNFMFFVAGGDRFVLRAMVESLHTHPPGALALGAASAGAVVAFGGDMFALALRIALPIGGLLLMTDTALAVAGRLQAQLQLLSLAFPIKMLASTFLLAALVPLVVLLYRQGFNQAAARIVDLLK